MGLKEPWAGVVVDVFADLKGALAAFNEGLVSIHSKCSAELNDLPDNYFVDVLREIETKINTEGKIRARTNRL